MTSRELDRAARQWADQQTDRLSEVPSVRAVYVSITSITGGVFFEWRTGTYQAAAVNVAYTPAVGDRVLVLMIDNQPSIVGKFA